MAVSRIRRSVVPAIAVLAMAVGAQSASAAWTQLGSAPSGGSVFLACKTAVSSSAFGPLWKVRLVLAAGPAVHSTAGFQVVRPGSGVIASVGLSAANGAWDVRETYASRWFPDRYTASATWRVPGGGAILRDSWSFATIGAC